MCYYKNILPIPKIKKFERFLFIGAHGCDIEKAAGGTVKKLTDMGKNVKFIITTDSASVVRKEPNEGKRKEMRQKEAMASALLLGVKEIEFFDFRDTGRYTREDLGRKLEDAIDAFSPDVVFVDDPQTPNELLLDDKQTAEESIKAIERVRNHYLQEEKGEQKKKIKAIAFYNANHPNSYVGINGVLLGKLNAVMLHSSLLPEKEEEKLAYMQTYKSLIRRTAIHMGLKSGKIMAEGFRVLGPGAMHNVPQII